MKLITIATSIAFLATSVLGAALPEGEVSSTALVPGYKNGAMQFSGIIGGVKYAANGTIQQITAQFQKDHPVAAASLEAQAANGTDLQTRGDLQTGNKRGPPLCCWKLGFGWDWDSANANDILRDADYLDAVARTGNVCGVDARTCVRIACSNQSGIVLCNDNNYPIYPQCDYMASYARDIVYACTMGIPTSRNPGADVRTCGQEFDTDNYNIIVRKETNNC
ncbi:hypothetical protein B0J14DRAFT_578375 [Halenospora varia]|nr:hypothetical protein B0J14DRAFT_578375 [Halenospora varia]